MKVQLITESLFMKSNDNVTVTRFSRPMAMDDFDVVIIDLSAQTIWRSNASTIGELNVQEDLRDIGTMVQETKNARIVYVYPQDGEYQYSSFGKKLNQSLRIKQIIGRNNYVKGYLECFPFDVMDQYIVFEPTQTTVHGTTYKADFHFSSEFGECITKSNISNKVTTVHCYNNIYVTTLDVCREMHGLKGFVDFLFSVKETTNVPEWIEEYNFGDDEEQRLVIKSSEESIVELNERIEEAQKKLAENARYKSILGSTGDELVEVVFDILEQMLDCDLSGFVDEKREDFLVEKEENIFIGEIKGVSTNVKNEHISQLDVHYQSYIDSFEELESTKNLHGLLIICPFRKKQLKDRDPIHEKQIDLAKRNGSLIIETSTLLKMFEMFKNGFLSSDKCEAVLAEKTGILKPEDFMEKIDESKT